MNIQKTSFLSNASLLLLGTAFSQLVVLLVTPILTRLYTPSDFGTFAFFLSIFGILSIISTGRYELGIPIARGNSFSLVVFALTIVILISFITILFLLNSPLRIIIQSLTDTKVENTFVFLIIIGLLFSGAYRSMSMYGFRNYKFRLVGFARIMQGVGLSSAQVIFGIIGVGKYGLIIGHIVGISLSTFLLLISFSQKFNKALKQLTAKRLQSATIRYKKFLIFSVWSDLINVFGNQLPTLILFYFYTPVEAGLYFLASKLANAPVSVVAEVMGKALFATSSKPQNKPILTQFIRGVYLSCVRLSIIPLICFIPFCTFIFEALFGEDWEIAGHYFQILLISSLGVFVNAPFLTLFHVFGAQQKEFQTQILIFLSRLIPIITFAAFSSAYLAILSYAVFTAIAYFISGIWALKVAKLNLNKLFISMLCEVAIVSSIFIVIQGLVLHGKNWSFVLAIFIFSTSCVFSIVSSLYKMRKCSRLLIS